MSVITELFENYDHIPVEFRRHLYLIRELDECASKLIQERESLKKELMKRQVLDDEEQRTRLYDRLQAVYAKIDAYNDEKLELVEKLFCMQENFIRKLDQQIEKTEEDKHVIEKCTQDLQNEDAEIASVYATKPNPKSKEIVIILVLEKTQPKIGGYSTFGKSGDFTQNSFTSSLDTSILGGPTKKIKNEPFGSKLDTSFGQMNHKKRDRPRDKQKILQGSSAFDSSNNSSFMFGAGGGVPSRRGALQNNLFSQDDNFGDLDKANGGGAGGMDDDEEDTCYICNTKKPSENWIQCDQCDKWFHYGCVGITQENVPHESEKYYCPGCKRLPLSTKMQRQYSEFGNNLLDDA